MNLQSVKERIADLIGFSVNLDNIIISKSDRYILCLHRLTSAEYAEQHSIHHSMWISPETFEKIICWLLHIGEIVSLDRVMDFSDAANKPLFCLTFDDGWLDNYQLAFPILKKYRVPATIFLVTDAITTGNVFWADELIEKTSAFFKTPDVKLKIWLQQKLPNHVPENKIDKGILNTLIEYLKTLKDAERNSVILDFYQTFSIDSAPLKGLLMNWDQVREMADQGIDFQSHTHTHKILVKTAEQEIYYELSKSKEILEEKLGKTCHHFCYPNARYEIQNAFLIGKAGYHYGYKIDNQSLAKPFDRYLVPRVLLCENYSQNLNYLKLKLLGLPVYNRK